MKHFGVTLIVVALTAMLSVVIALAMSRWVEARPPVDHTAVPIYEFVHEGYELGNRYTLDVIKDLPGGQCFLLITQVRDLSVPQPVVVGFAAVQSACRIPQ